ADAVIASDTLPVAASIYQAAKIAAAAAPLVRPGGRLVVVAERAAGLGGPLATVNNAILRIGVLPRLPDGATLHLVSSLPRALVSETLFEPGLPALSGSILVVPTASQLLCEATA